MRTFEKSDLFRDIDKDGKWIVCVAFTLLTSTNKGILDCTEKQTYETVLRRKNIGAIIKKRLNKRADEELKKVGAKETAWPKSPA